MRTTLFPRTEQYFCLLIRYLLRTKPPTLWNIPLVLELEVIRDKNVRKHGF